MTTVLFATLAMLVVAASALYGGTMIRRAAPTLMRTPRLAVAILLMIATLWLLGLAALGPLLAWGLAGPEGLLPGTTGLVCQRCLDAANPLPQGAQFNTVIPAIFFLLLPIVLLLLMSVNTAKYFRQTLQHRNAVQRYLQSANARRRNIAGHEVTVIAQPDPVAFAINQRQGSIIVSTGLLELISPAELRAVLTHEAAHLRQRHHLILNLLHGATAALRWIPLIRAINDAVPHYLEMAADNAARRCTSTPILASALLKLGEKTMIAPGAAAGESVALHAAGVDRIRHLVAPPKIRQGLVGLSVLTGSAVLLLAGSLSVHLPYIMAVLNGCLLR